LGAWTTSKIQLSNNQHATLKTQNRYTLKSTTSKITS